MKLKKMCVFTISMLITFSLTLTSSFAAIDYTKQANREAQNAKVMSKTVKIAAYKSKTLSDKVDGLGLECTKITTSQQKKIAALAKSIIKEKYNADDISSTCNIRKTVRWQYGAMDMQLCIRHLQDRRTVRQLML